MSETRKLMIGDKVVHEFAAPLECDKCGEVIELEESADYEFGYDYQTEQGFAKGTHERCRDNHVEPLPPIEWVSDQPYWTNDTKRSFDYSIHPAGSYVITDPRLDDE